MPQNNPPNPEELETNADGLWVADCRVCDFVSDPTSQAQALDIASSHYENNGPPPHACEVVPA